MWVGHDPSTSPATLFLEEEENARSNTEKEI